MDPRLFDLSTGITSYVIASVVVVLAVVATLLKPLGSGLDGIPTFGSSGWFSSWRIALKYRTNTVNIIQKGYEKHKPAPFKIATIRHWLVILSSREHTEEVQRASADTLSFEEVINDQLQIEYMIGPEIHHNPYHVAFIHPRLTRSLVNLYPEIRDEIATAFSDTLDLSGSGWKSVAALSCVQQVVCRASSRVFVGLPLCRDPDWIDLGIHFTIDVTRGSAIIALFPSLLKPIATWLFSNIYQSRQRGMKLLGPIIEDRLKHLNEYGHEWTDKPDDFLSWMMDEAEGPELTVKSLTSRILHVMVAAIHTTSSSFGHALFYLAANPQYVQSLREEVEGIVEQEGWTKAALAKMHKIESFLKECQRIEIINCVSLHRKAMKDFTFSDGTFVPKGTVFATAARSIQRDEAFYENALTFEPFRFANLPQGDSKGMRHQLVSTSVEYLPFGHGRQACPGRFFAADELKTMLAHVVVTYDVRLEDGATQPQSLHFGTLLLPDPCTKVMFRRRAD